MTEKKFDDIVKGKLNELTPEGDQGGWSFFESKLEKAENSSTFSDSDFDSAVKNQLLSSRPPFKSEHWRQLKSQLKIIEERKNTIFVSKILELAAIFLIFFTFSHLSTKSLETNQKIVPASGLYADSAMSSDEKKSEKPENTAALKSILKEEGVRKFVSIPSVSVVSKVKKDIIAEVDFHANEVKPENVFFTKTKDANSETSADAANIQNENGSLLQYPDITNISGIKAAENNVSIEGLTQSLNNLPLELLSSELAISFPLQPTTVKRKTIFSVAAWAATDVNLINTPFDKFYSLASYKKEALNNSYGLNFSFKKSDVEIETGLGYSKRIYQPAKITEAYGVFGENYFEKSLNKISYDVASVPFNIKFHALHSAGWSAYLMAGAAFNLVLNAEYDITETLVRGRPPVGRYVPEMARLDSKPFIQGVIRGDSFRDNYFATLGFGFGIEKRMFKNTSFYVQPSYFRQVLSAGIGIGPNKDKIHTSSLQVGIKTTIN